MNTFNDILQRGSAQICKETEQDEPVELLSVSFEFRDYIESWTIVFELREREYILKRGFESKVSKNEPLNIVIIERSKKLKKVSKRLDKIVNHHHDNDEYLNAW